MYDLVMKNTSVGILTDNMKCMPLWSLEKDLWTMFVVGDIDFIM